MKRLFYTLILVGMVCIGYARPNDSTFVKGIILTADKQIDCFIKSKESYSGKIKYKLDYQKRKKLKIHCTDVVQIVHSGNYFDKVIINDEGHHLLKRICKGEISLYKRIKEEDNPPMYNVATGTSLSIGSKEDEIYYILKDEKVIELDKKTYQKVLKNLMKEKPEILEKAMNLEIEDEKFVHKLSVLIAEYNG